MNPILKIIEEGEKEVSGGNVFWKVINKNITPETQLFIKSFQKSQTIKLLEGVREEIPNTYHNQHFYTLLSDIIIKISKK